MVKPTNHVITWAGFTLRGALGTGDVCSIFLPNIGEDQKIKISPSERGVPGIAPYYGKSSPSYCITFIKRLDEGLRQQLLG